MIKKIFVGVVLTILAVSAVGVLLPSLGSHRRDTHLSRLLQSDTHVRLIHQGCILYAYGADSRFPDDIGTLYVNDIVPIEYVLSPLVGKTSPADIESWSDEQKRKWVNEHTSYVLVPGLTDDVDATRVAVFTKLQDCGGQYISIAYNDNHVVSYPIARASGIIKKKRASRLKLGAG